MNNPDRIIDLLRHGRPIGGDCFRGNQDDALSDQGMAQLQTATMNFNSWDSIISSPLKRCSAFAEKLAKQRDIPFTIDPELRERHFGVWEGKHAKQIPADELELYWNDPSDFTPENAEPFPDFLQRAVTAWDNALHQPYKNPLIITHGGIIRAIVGHVLNMPAHSLILLEVPYANLSRIRVPIYERGKPSLMFQNASL